MSQTPTQPRSNLTEHQQRVYIHNYAHAAAMEAVARCASDPTQQASTDLPPAAVGDAPPAPTETSPRMAPTPNPLAPPPGLPSLAGAFPNAQPHNVMVAPATVNDAVHQQLNAHVAAALQRACPQAGCAGVIMCVGGENPRWLCDRCQQADPRLCEKCGVEPCPNTRRVCLCGIDHFEELSSLTRSQRNFCISKRLEEPRVTELVSGNPHKVKGATIETDAMLEVLGTVQAADTQRTGRLTWPVVARASDLVVGGTKKAKEACVRTFWQRYCRTSCAYQRRHREAANTALQMLFKRAPALDALMRTRKLRLTSNIGAFTACGLNAATQRYIEGVSAEDILAQLKASKLLSTRRRVTAKSAEYLNLRAPDVGTGPVGFPAPQDDSESDEEDLEEDLEEGEEEDEAAPLAVEAPPAAVEALPAAVPVPSEEPPRKRARLMSGLGGLFDEKQ